MICPNLFYLYKRFVILIKCFLIFDNLVIKNLERQVVIPVKTFMLEMQKEHIMLDIEIVVLQDDIMVNEFSLLKLINIKSSELLF